MAVGTTPAFDNTAGDKNGSFKKALLEHVFVPAVVQCANGPQPVEYRDVQISDEVGIGYTEPELLFHGVSHAVCNIGSGLKKSLIAGTLAAWGDVRR